MAKRSEFTVHNAYRYNHRSPLRWMLSHIWRYKFLLIFTGLMYFVGWSSFGYARVLIGQAADAIIHPDLGYSLPLIALGVLFVLVLDGVSFLAGNLSLETLAQRLERGTREELYISLLGKSQAFHDRQRVGDIMARSNDDVKQLNVMINPGVLFIFETFMGLAVPMFYIASYDLELLIAPVFIVLSFIVTVRIYSRQLNPVMRDQRDAFGLMNAGLEETISGIEIVKASTQEEYERGKFHQRARKYRDYFVQQGRVEARYLPTLLFAFAYGFTFLHTMLLLQQGRISIPDIIAIMALVGLMRFPIFISIFSFSLIELGMAGAERILRLITAETDLDQNAEGYAGRIEGSIVFEGVTYGFEDGDVLENISFAVQPGETLAIVGQTGSGKSTLTELINRTYDVTAGRILVDGVDVRDWSMEALRSQISKIEQDVFLFSRTIGENIAFGAPDATQEQIEQAAREAQAHDFIMGFPQGYQTEIGERGVTLSGGQRQRIALARAFLSDPRILILDDSTSAIDSATEDEIQRAIHRARQGRTTLLITHRLSQIRWADHILVLDGGRVVAYGKHDDLLRTSDMYRRIFSRYDAALPPLQSASQPAYADALANR